MRVSTLSELVDHALVSSIELVVETNTLLDDVNKIMSSDAKDKINSMNVVSVYDDGVLDVLLCANPAMSCLSICGAFDSKLPQWEQHLTRIGPSLKELDIWDPDCPTSLLRTISLNCPNLEKLHFWTLSAVWSAEPLSTSILLSLALGCPKLRALSLKTGAFFSDGR